MNILNILHTPKIGGTEVAYLKLCNQLSKIPEVLGLFCLVPKNAEIYPQLTNSDPSLKQKIKIIENNKVYKNPRLLNFVFVRQLRKLIIDNNINIVIANNGRITSLAKKAAHNLCPVISVNHGTNPKKTSKADYAFVVNSFQYEQIKNFGLNQEKVFLIPNSISIQTESLKKDKNQVPVIGTIGRLSKEKGFDHFLHALRILKDRNIQFRAIIGGDGEEMVELLNLAKILHIENQVKFLGWIDDKGSFFKKINLFCLPSAEEAFGIVLLEAMNYRVPIVATECHGPVDIISNGVSGLLCKIGNPQSMAESLEKLINDHESQRRYSELAFKKLESDYSDQVVYKKIHDAIKFIYLHSK